MDQFEDQFAARLLTGIAVGLVLKVGIVGFWALFGLEAILVVSFCVLVTFLPAAVVITDRDRPVGTGIVIGFFGGILFSMLLATSQSRLVQLFL